MVRLSRFLQPYGTQILLVVLLVFAQSLANLYLPTLMAEIVNIGIAQGNTAFILRIGGLMLLVSVGGVLCAIVGNFFSARVAVGSGQQLRSAIFKHVASFSLQEFDTISTTSLIVRTTNDTTQVQLMLVIILNMMISAPLIGVGSVILAISQDAELAWILIASLPVLAIAISIIMSKGIPLFRLIQSKIDTLNLVLSESLTGIRVIRAFARNEYEQRRFDNANQDLMYTTMRVNRIVATLMPIILLTLNLSSIAIIWFGSIRVQSGALQIGSLLAFMQYTMQILLALLMISVMFIMLPRAIASAARINEVLGMQPAIRDQEITRQATHQQGHIEFQNVTFSYPGAEKPALSHLTFQANPGEVIALIGGTGAGKSTLINLMLRFYDCDSGHILVDGIDVRELSQEHLRAKIGLVSQKVTLFSDTVAQNIRYGKDEASDEEVMIAARIAQTSDFIASLPEGFDTPVAQGGLNLSGGQRQRLSIARALVRRPEIYVFDDSFSALDLRTERRLRTALKQEKLHATIIIVTQRINTVMDADRIIVLDEGHIAGIGKHHELIENCEIYREILSSQLSGGELQ